MNRLLMGGALGALAMYFLDPQQGRRRRARTRDKAVHASRVLNEAGKVTARDTVHRARGVWASTRKFFDHEPVGDEVLVSDRALTAEDALRGGRFPNRTHPPNPQAGLFIRRKTIMPTSSWLSAYLNRVTTACCTQPVPLPSNRHSISTRAAIRRRIFSSGFGHT